MYIIIRRMVNVKDVFYNYKKSMLDTLEFI